MSRQNPLFLGCGWAFPPRFTLTGGDGGPQEGAVETVSAEADIRQSLRILMETRRGERVLRPLFGLGLWEHVYDRMDETTLGDLKSQIEDAILRWEPRIKLEEVVFETDNALDGELHIRLTYLIRAVNSRDNAVYPFYIREGTSLRGPDAGEATE